MNELRSSKISEATLDRVGYHVAKPGAIGELDKELLTLISRVGDRECTTLWILFWCVAAVALGIIGFAIYFVGTNFSSIMGLRVTGRQGGAAPLWLLLGMVAMGSCSFLIAIWYTRNRLKQNFQLISDLLPRCVQIPVKMDIVKEKDNKKFPHVASLTITTPQAVVTQRWLIINAGTNLWGKPHDSKTASWLEQQCESKKRSEGVLLVDQDGEPCALLADDHVLWILSNRFLQNVELTNHSNVPTEATEAKRQLRQLVRLVHL